MPEIRKDIKNILVVRNDRFGEFLLNIPAFRALKETYPQAKLIAAVNPYVKELAVCIPYIDEILEWPAGDHDFLEKFDLILRLKERNIDAVLILNPTRQWHLISYFAGIPIRAGYDRKMGFLLTDKIKDDKNLGARHEVYSNLEIAGLIGAYTEDKTLSINIEPKEADGILRKFKVDPEDTLFAVHPWTSDPVKEWPLDNFIGLVKKINSYANGKILIIGRREEVHRSFPIFGWMNDVVIDFTGRTSLRELGALLKRCKFLVSGDSGPVHLACTVGTPVLAIFRNDIAGKGPKRWGPWGDKNVVVEGATLSAITVDEVFECLRKSFL
ncbi:glycosyltransferase family 9 protein [bacterium]|nr:MAG: glycosyltransferase family 9 protein [bacterium]